MAINIDKKNALEIEELDTIFITGGGFVNRAFKGIGVNSAMGWNETVWATNLSRSNTFAFQNIDDVDIGQVAQCQINFPIMNYADFLDLQKILKERHVMVNYFNVDLGKRVIQEMAITGNERKKLYAFGNAIVGMQNVNVKFVATNRDLELLDLTITYNSNGGEGTIESVEITYSEQLNLSNGEGFTKSGYHIKEWNTKADGTGNSYGLNQSITCWIDLDLYAIWE